MVIVVYCYSTLQIPLLGALAGEEKLGIYRSALMLAAGLDLLYGSLNVLLLPRLVRWKQLGATLFRRKQAQLFAASSGMGICVAAASIIAAPTIYRLMLGPRFAGGAVPFQILALARSVVFVGQIYSNSLVALGLDRQFLWATIAGAVFSVTANIYAIPKFGIPGAAVVSLAAEVIVCTLCFVFTNLHFRGHQVEPPPTAR
jgi:PST family polysaccharide transporter